MQEIVEMDKSTKSLKMTVYASLFAALMAVGAFIAVPIGPVPIVLQNMFVLMAALILGVRWGCAAILLYLFMGACGFPVFAGGTGGIGKLFGPTGGYLLGYVPAVLVTAIISHLNGRTDQKQTGREDSSNDGDPKSGTGNGMKIGLNILAMIVGSLIVYAVGVPWLKFTTGMGWSKAVSAGMFPFLVGDAVKAIAGSILAYKLTPLMNVNG